MWLLSARLQYFGSIEVPGTLKNTSFTLLAENFLTPFTPLHTLCAITALFSNKERIEIAVKIHNTYSKSEICDSDVPYVSGHNPRLAMLLLVSGSRYIFCELSSSDTMGSKFVEIFVEHEWEF